MKNQLYAAVLALLIVLLLFIILSRPTDAESIRTEETVQPPRPEPVYCDAIITDIPERPAPTATPRPVPDHRYFEQAAEMASDIAAADAELCAASPEPAENPPTTALAGDRAAVPPPFQGGLTEEEAGANSLIFLGSFWCTGYDGCESCCGKTDGITSSGTVATAGRTIAAGSQFPYGTRLYIEGIGERVVEDRGGGISGTNLDVFCVDHPACYTVTGWHDVYLVEEPT